MLSWYSLDAKPNNTSTRAAHTHTKQHNQDTHWLNLYIYCFGSSLSSHDPISFVYTFNFNWFLLLLYFNLFSLLFRSLDLLALPLLTCSRYVSLRWINDGLAGHWSIARWFGPSSKIAYRLLAIRYLVLSVPACVCVCASGRLSLSRSLPLCLWSWRFFHRHSYADTIISCLDKLNRFIFGHFVYR